MNLFVIVKVEEVGEHEPLCATRVALNEKEAAAFLLEMADLGPPLPDRIAGCLEDPFGLAEALSGDNGHFYVEAHKVNP
jgi:hypothetical protein